MSRQITPEQHWLLSFKPGNWLERANARGIRVLAKFKRFTKPGENQDAAIKRLMSALKRKPPTRTASCFPTFHPGMTTADYMRAYQQLNNGLKPVHDLSKLERPAPFHTGPEVTVETIDDEVFA